MLLQVKLLFLQHHFTTYHFETLQSLLLQTNQLNSPIKVHSKILRYEKFMKKNVNRFLYSPLGL